MRAWFGRLSRPAQTVLAFGTLFVLLAMCGQVNATADVRITSEQAIARALPEIDFEPVDVGARMVRQGFGSLPVWAVSLSIPLSGGEDDEYERIAMVEINGRTGDVIRIRIDDELR